MTDRFKNALVRMPDVKSDDIAEMAMDWYAYNYDTLKLALTLATESEQLRKERDELAVLLGLYEKYMQDFVRETTCMSAENLGKGVNFNGSHDCRISKATLEGGREVLRRIKQAKRIIEK